MEGSKQEWKGTRSKMLCRCQTRNNVVLWVANGRETYGLVTRNLGRTGRSEGANSGVFRPAPIVLVPDKSASNVQTTTTPHLNFVLCVLQFWLRVCPPPKQSKPPPPHNNRILFSSHPPPLAPKHAHQKKKGTHHFLHRRCLGVEPQTSQSRNAAAQTHSCTLSGPPPRQRSSPI